MQRTDIYAWTLMLLFGTLLLFGCTPQTPTAEPPPQTPVAEIPSATPAERTQARAATRTAAPTAAPTRTPTTAPTAKPTSAPTPLPTSTRAPLADTLGQPPWLLLATGQGLWAVDYQGRGRLALTDQAAGGPSILQMAVSPTGTYVAYLTTSDDFLHDLTLVVRTLPGGETALTLPLTSAETEPGPNPGPGEPNFETARAITEVTSLAWSPAGRQLAFMGAHAGSSSDLYVYTPETGEIQHLTDGPSEGIKPLWSPDGRYIVHAGVSTLGTGAGYGMQGVWAAAADGSAVKTLYTPQSGDEIWLGWADDNTFIVYSFNATCGFHNLRTWQIDTGKERVLWASNLTHAAHDPVSNKILMAVPENLFDCNPTGLQGLALTHPQAQDTFVVAEAEARRIVWSAEANAFLVETRDDRLLSVTPEGDVVALSGPSQRLPAYAPDGQTLAWAGGEGVWLEQADGERQQIFTDSAVSPIWAPNGESLLFFGRQGEHSFNLYVAPASSFEPRVVLESAPPDRFAWAAPSE